MGPVEDGFGLPTAKNRCLPRVKELRSVEADWVWAFVAQSVGLVSDGNLDQFPDRIVDLKISPIERSLLSKTESS